MGLDISMQKVQAYRVSGDRIVVTVSQHYPVQDVEDFTVSPLRAQVQETQSRRRTTREKSTVHKLVAAKAIEDGTLLTLHPINEVTQEVRDAVSAWIAEDPRGGEPAGSTGSVTRCSGSSTGRPSTLPLVAAILSEAADITRTPRGPRWWRLPDGRDLAMAAGAVTGGVFDWSGLHTMMTRCPRAGGPRTGTWHKSSAPRHSRWAYTWPSARTASTPTVCWVRTAGYVPTSPGPIRRINASPKRCSPQRASASTAMSLTGLNA